MENYRYSWKNGCFHKYAPHFNLYKIWYSTWFCNMGGQALEMYHIKLYFLIISQLKYSYPH